MATRVPANSPALSAVRSGSTARTSLATGLSPIGWGSRCHRITRLEPFERLAQQVRDRCDRRHADVSQLPHAGRSLGTDDADTEAADRAFFTQDLQSSKRV